ncbi:MAG TPA: YkgJ family cysteine cluster protein [Gallionella sp.]|nr:YkgJ family cysteine cluster protein [Gallionella sp.]
MTTANLCQTCGACCAHFRVSFYWAEADDAPGGIVPAELTEAVSPHLRCMKGTASKPARCVALEGEVGKWVSCTIYQQRSSTCREFDVLEPDGTTNPRCAALRAQLHQA